MSANRGDQEMAGHSCTSRPLKDLGSGSPTCAPSICSALLAISTASVKLCWSVKLSMCLTIGQAFAKAARVCVCGSYDANRYSFWPHK